ncbi:PREDICTED: inositol 1,4,5-trisphosphate receptor-interacting protein-like 1 [Calidris pugnax]|uniref:inositol 1,4,5-trisphosphate receptor-interacting protein-like 1 n=1 Tax=Calidris pugnax TaxID=198806 RepID=UPI00071DC53B|nr:PREDICTED: inositol 1,4,5-trisphosphate receptor-interacting protein-like 1 [Calidris pugnax]
MRGTERKGKSPRSSPQPRAAAASSQRSPSPGTPQGTHHNGGGFIKGASRQLPQYGLGHRRVRFKAMASMTVRVLVLLSFFLRLPVVGKELEEATHEHMRLREEHLNQEMAQLMVELEQRSQEQSTSAPGALLLAALQHWQFWAVAGVLVLFLGLCWWLRNRSHEEKEVEEEEEEEEDEPLDMYRFLDEHPLWPQPDREEGVGTMLEELVNDLLCVCRILSSNSFMPWLQPAVSMGGFAGAQALSEDFVYRLLVPLKPPPGHSFHLKRDSKGDNPVRDSRLLVTLECTCQRHRRLGDMLCFLHHPEDELMTRQEANLLQTLCIGSYLDMQKTAFWLQGLMTAASVDLFEDILCRLTVLPSTRFCKFKLTNSVGTFLYVELILAVKVGNTFVTME